MVWCLLVPFIEIQPYTCLLKNKIIPCVPDIAKSEKTNRFDRAQIGQNILLKRSTPTNTRHMYASLEREIDDSTA